MMSIGWALYVEMIIVGSRSSSVEVLSIVITCVYVCLFVCLSARISQKPHVQISPNFLYILSVAWLGPSLTAMRYVMYFRYCG